MATLIIPEISDDVIIVHVLNIGEGGIFFTLRSSRDVELNNGQILQFKEVHNKNHQKFSLDVSAEVAWISANFSLEFDCEIKVDDIKPLVKVINYAINYIGQLADQPQEISLNASMSGITIGFTTFTNVVDLPEINPKVSEALVPYNAVLEQKGEPGKYTQLLITFSN